MATCDLYIKANAFSTLDNAKATVLLYFNHEVCFTLRTALFGLLYLLWQSSQWQKKYLQNCFIDSIAKQNLQAALYFIVVTTFKTAPTVLEKKNKQEENIMQESYRETIN